MNLFESFDQEPSPRYGIQSRQWKGFQMIIKILISLLALAADALRVWVPSINIDATTGFLIIIAILPWLSSVFSSVELPGGWKFKFRELQKAADNAVKAGLIPQMLSRQEEQEYSFQSAGIRDANLALAGLRIEIEKRLKLLADRNNLGTRMQGIGSLLNALSNKQIISDQERSIIHDMIGMLNDAVHGARIDDKSAQWALEFGPRLLKSLDERLPKKGKSHG